MSSFTEALVVSPLPDGKTWVLQRAFTYHIDEVGSGKMIKVVPGFMTDFASIPRIFWGILPKWGKYGNAAVVHDWNYWMQELNNVDRKQSDQIMLQGMGVLGVPKWQRFFIYYAVRWFGGLAWKRNKWDREAGFIRVDPDVAMDQPKMTEDFKRPSMMKRAIERMKSPPDQPLGEREAVEPP